MKSCKNCGAEFQPKHETRGHEQIYCSIKCRNEAYKKRVNERAQAEQHEKPESIGNVERKDNGLLQLRSDSHTDLIGLLEKLGEAKTEVVRYQLKCEALEKENQELKIKVSQLEMELDSLEDSDDDPENDIIAGVMTNFKKDPVNTINFASALISQLFKPKTDAQTATTQKPS